MVFGPQTGHRLTDGAYGILHCPRSNGVTIFGEAAVAVADGKDHEVVNWVRDGVEERVDGVLQAKVLPDNPRVVLCVGTARNNCGSTRFLCSAEIRAERISLRRRHSRQGFG